MKYLVRVEVPVKVVSDKKLSRDKLREIGVEICDLGLEGITSSEGYKAERLKVSKVISAGS